MWLTSTEIFGVLVIICHDKNTITLTLKQNNILAIMKIILVFNCQSYIAYFFIIYEGI
jgi:hypothetical protein